MDRAAEFERRKQEVRDEWLAQNGPIAKALRNVKHRVAVFSGKGGVGKTCATVNLGAALHERGYKVAIFDADVHGPGVPKTLGILGLGALAFCIGTMAGILMGKLMHRVSGGKVNPLIGAAGVSAVPMAARVVNKVGLEANHHNFLLMHAMGPNVAGVIGSAVAAGVLLAVVGG